MGPTRRGVLALAGGWLVVVLGVGAVTFVVVSRAGSEVGQASAMRTVAGLPSSSRADPSASPTTSSPRPSASSPDPSDTAEPTGSAPPEGPSAPVTRTESFTTAAGTVVASCTGSTLRRESITARDGWRFEDEVEHGRLEVRFRPAEEREGDEGPEDDEGSEEVRLEVGCVDGAPTRSAH